MTNVLVLDDEEHISTILSLYLKKLGYKCKTLNSVNRALELEDTSLAPISNADIIISDFDMQENTAIDLLRYLADNNINKKIIIRSGNNTCQEQIKKAGYEKLVNVFLDKSTSLFKLKDILEKLK